MRTILAVVVGVALGVGGTIGVQAATEASDAASEPSFRSEVRKGLAEEWGDIYAECIQAANEEPTNPYLPENPLDGADRTRCKQEANRVLP